MESHKGGLFIERRRAAAIAVSAPMHGPGSQETPQALGRHGTFHRMEVPKRSMTGYGNRGDGIVLDPAIGITQIPGEAVDVSKDMAACTRAVAMSRTVSSIVEELASLTDELGLRTITQRDGLNLRFGLDIHNRNGVIEAVHDI